MMMKGSKHKRCPICGKAIRSAYTYCARCYDMKYKHSYTGGIKKRMCARCGATIDTKYKYCWSCAKSMQLINDNEY